MCLLIALINYRVTYVKKLMQVRKFTKLGETGIPIFH